ncbi:Protein OS-9 [Desmophyllum pertusum]|uniref:Protein OS-9 n=1 Tax=Desmophyllum pertusum TaxID=174260 RepID=A0A9X0A1M5_9CNID|nr:Protein OS-9 [Desmophyllum pertusum]
MTRRSKKRFVDEEENGGARHGKNEFAKPLRKWKKWSSNNWRDSGVLPSGKIRVKIVTSKDALEKMDGKNDMKLLSEQEETQFRDMILGLLGGSPDAGKRAKAPTRFGGQLQPCLE